LVSVSPEALMRAGPPFAVEYQHSKTNNFPQDMRDDVWLEICGKRHWIAFSHDQKFHSINVEAMAIKQHMVGTFCLPGASEPLWENYVISFGHIQ
jgi:PIN like domain